MNLLPQIRDLFTDFLFPKSRKVVELEALSIDALLSALPPAENLKDKNTIALFDYASRRMGQLILIPMPISDKRRFERGWNQAELLAKEIVAHDREKMFKYLPKQLAKYRHTESQTKTASRSERLENLINSMKVLNPSSVAGICVIVLDDVTTTGATFAEARGALRAAGARKILCIAIAH